MDLVQALEAVVLDGAAELPPAMRRAAATPGDLPAPLAAYCDMVALRAYAVTDADLEALRQAGQTDDQLFELTVSAATGAGMRRFRAGMAALAAAEAEQRGSRRSEAGTSSGTSCSSR